MIFGILIALILVAVVWISYCDQQRDLETEAEKRRLIEKIGRLETEILELKKDLG